MCGDCAGVFCLEVETSNTMDCSEKLMVACPINHALSFTDMYTGSVLSNAIKFGVGNFRITKDFRKHILSLIDLSHKKSVCCEQYKKLRLPELMLSHEFPKCNWKIDEKVSLNWHTQLADGIRCRKVKTLLCLLLKSSPTHKHTIESHPSPQFIALWR